MGKPADTKGNVNHTSAAHCYHRRMSQHLPGRNGRRLSAVWPCTKPTHCVAAQMSGSGLSYTEEKSFLVGGSSESTSGQLLLPQNFSIRCKRGSGTAAFMQFSRLSFKKSRIPLQRQPGDVTVLAAAGFGNREVNSTLQLACNIADHQGVENARGTRGAGSEEGTHAPPKCHANTSFRTVLLCFFLPVKVSV